MQKKHYPTIIEQDANGVFIVSCPSFKGFHSYGHTIDEAKKISEAIAACLEDQNTEEEPTKFIGIRDVETAI